SNGHGLRVGDEAVLFVRPERLSLVGAATEGENVIESEVGQASFEGSFAHIFLAGPQGRDIVVHTLNDGAMPQLPVGSRAHIRFAPEDAVVLPKGELA